MAAPLLLLEHVNVNLPRADAAAARAFFLAEGLGMLEDPRPAAMGKAERLLWADAGLQQLHLPLVDAGNAEGDVAPQVLRGEVGLAFASAADVAAVLARLRLLRPQLAGTHFSVPEDGGAPRVTCPFGGAYTLAVTSSPRRSVGGPGSARGHPPPLTPQQPIARPVGIQWLRLDMPASSAAAIAAFWRSTLGADVEEAADGEVRVSVGGGEQLLRFVAVPSASLRAYDGHHICLYLSEPAFEAAFRSCEAQGLLYDPGRFADRGGSWALALENAQFRVLHVPQCECDDGAFRALGLTQRLQGGLAPAFSLELELRSPRHPACPLGP